MCTYLSVCLSHTLRVSESWQHSHCPGELLITTVSQAALVGSKCCFCDLGNVQICRFFPIQWCVVVVPKVAWITDSFT